MRHIKKIVFGILVLIMVPIFVVFIGHLIIHAPCDSSNKQVQNTIEKLEVYKTKTGQYPESLDVIGLKTEAEYSYNENSSFSLCYYRNFLGMGGICCYESKTGKCWWR